MHIWTEQSSVQTCISDGHPHTVTYTRHRTDTTECPDDEHVAARNMYRTEINIYTKEIVHQVDYLQGLYKDAWSTNHKI